MLTLYSIYTKKVLPSVNQEVCLLSYYNNAYSIILFIPLILVNGEATVLMNYGHFHSWFNESKNTLWWTSNVIVLASSAFYARFKQQEMEEKSRRAVPIEKRSLV
ncbi:putative GDP-fucose transporter [Operophtera brumata]|uniref:Putative GDP-fucose transporter n=1 Tax=Operophtera brumata TaxID=104452 RepID=A0A0L7LH88_OPEBR|nr:putative GDP-fucose transporter [Operophtera brumata]